MYHDAPIRVTSTGDGTQIRIDATGPLSLAAALELAKRLTLIALIGLALEPTASQEASSRAPESQPSPLDRHAPTPPPRAA